ncbi:hypothetical protein ABT025_34600 [Streptomyces sp. NPDC002809]|uniref:hypothetical protein n=1 Tax=Streptomyces sp. NPDC002809 TaxID=3154433 RepID=UPI003327640B
MLGTEVRRDLTRQFFTPGDTLDGGAMAEALAVLEADGPTALGEQHIPAERRRVEHAVDMRYEGQDYTLTVPLTDSAEPAAEGFPDSVADRFAALHERRYGHATPGAPVEFVTLRTTALGALPPLEAAAFAPETGGTPTPRSKSVFFDGTAHDTPVLRREQLSAGTRLAGPAIIVEATSTTVVPPDATVTVDAHGFLVIKLDRGRVRGADQGGVHVLRGLQQRAADDLGGDRVDPGPGRMRGVGHQNAHRPCTCGARPVAPSPCGVSGRGLRSSERRRPSIVALRRKGGFPCRRGAARPRCTRSPRAGAIRPEGSAAAWPG